METVGGAYGDTGRFESLVDAVHTIIAFNHFSGFRIPLGGTPGACRYARLAANTKGCVYEHDSVFWPLLHGPGWTGGNTPRIFAVKAGHERICGPWQVTDKSRTHGHDLAQSGPNRQILVGLTDHLAAATPDTLFRILKQVVMAHHVSLRAPNSLYPFYRDEGVMHGWAPSNHVRDILHQYRIVYTFTKRT